MKPFESGIFSRPGRAVLAFAVAVALCAAAAILLPEGLTRIALAAVIFLPVLFVAIERPEIVFYFLVVILFSNLDVLTGIRIYRIVLTLSVFVLALQVLDGRKLVWHHPVLLALGASFAILVFQSVSVARDEQAAVIQMVKFEKIIFVVVLAFQFVRNRVEFKRFLIVMALGIGLTAAAPLVLSPPKRLVSLSLLWEQGVFRYEGFVFEPNQFAMMLLMLLPVLFFFLVISRRSILRLSAVSLAILGSVAALILTFSRGGFVGLAALLLALILVERRNPWIFASCAIVVIAAIALSPSAYWERIQSMIAFARGERLDLSIETRIEAMKEAFRLGLAHPLLGVGVDNFLYSIGTALPYRMVVHNTFLQVFSELGMLAFAIFIVIIIHNYILVWNMMKSHDEEVSLLGRLLFVQQSAVFASAFFITVAYDFFLWFLIALPAMANYSYRIESESPAQATEGF